MSKIVINKKIESFNRTILIPGDKSLSIRWVLFASLASGISKAKNLKSLKIFNGFAKGINPIKIAKGRSNFF